MAQRLTVARHSVVIGLGALLVASAGGVSHAQTSESIELRVWQNVENGREIHVSARWVASSWDTLGIIPLDGSPGRCRYGDIALDVPLGSQRVSD